MNHTMLKKLLRRVLPDKYWHCLKRYSLRYRCRPPIGWVRFGNLRRLSPISTVFGFDRGIPIDRYYIEIFLCKYAECISGSVMEVADATYSQRFGGRNVREQEVLHVIPGNPKATRIGNLATGESIPTAEYDCIILSQVFPFIYDVQSAVYHSHAALRPGGVLLATFPGISQISRYDMERWGDYWRFTDASARRLFSNVFGEKNVKIEIYGNVLSACAFLQGLAAEELKESELDFCDPDYQVIIAVRAAKRSLKEGDREHQAMESG